MKKLILLVAAVLMFSPVLWAQDPTTYKFADRSSGPLYMDIYYPTVQSNNTCVVFIFGGGFIVGTRVDQVDFLRQLAGRGYTVAAIDYRLGLKGIGKIGVSNYKLVFRAADIAAEDLISATDYLIKNSLTLGIDTKRIVTIGSSAGAITALQADYQLANRSKTAKLLPDDFRYAGVVAMAGAILSTDGRPKYARQPAPTMMLHGTEDKLVVYNKIQIFKTGMFGTNAIAKAFVKGDYPYMAIRYVGNEHDVASFPMHYNFEQICNFVDSAAAGKYTNQLDIMVKDRYAVEHFRKNIKRSDLYNKKSKTSSKQSPPMN